MLAPLKEKNEGGIGCKHHTIPCVQWLGRGRTVKHCLNIAVRYVLELAG